ncbi:MAG: serine protease [Deltaproteobacteria bacterium]|nr:MAG: serine protease [Deltaproteobacteria bacterium]
MLHHLKTLRDLGLSAAITLVLFGSPVGVAAIKNVPMLQEAIEQPEETRVVYLPPPPPPKAPAADDSGKESTPSESPDTQKLGGSGVPVEAVAKAGATSARHYGGTAGTVRGTRFTPAKKAKTPRTSRCTPDNPQIVVEDRNYRVVERALVDHYTGDLSELNRLGYVKKHVGEDGGKSDGLLVRGIRCGNDLHELGIRNNDIVHTVNGKKVRNLLQAVAVYLKLKGQEDFVVELTRGGKRVTLRYRLT